MVFSIWVGIRRTLGSPGGILGWLTASVSLFNLVQAVFEFPISYVFGQVLYYYRAVLHSILEAIPLPLSIELSTIAKDLVILYLLIGGVLVRFMELDQGRRGLKYSWRYVRNHLFRRFPSILTFSPSPVRQSIAVLFWPYFIYGLVYQDPFIIYEIKTWFGRHDMSGMATYIGEEKPPPVPYHDKRIVFWTSISLTIIGLFLFFALNAFTVAPA